MTRVSAGLFARFLTTAGVLVAGASLASAQTTVTLNQRAQITHGTVRAGSYANKNYATLLATRASSSKDYLRRAIVKFDTESTIPKGSHVTSAILTMTVKNGSEDASRRVGVYQVRQSFTDTEMTWNSRRKGQSWSVAGGDLGTLLDTETVGNAPGTRVKFDITALVQQAVSGALGSSRYTRVALADRDASASASYREYYTRDDSTSLRPTLTVTYGKSSSSTTTSTPSDPPPSSSSGSTLRVLHWNTHHGGVGTDGKLDQNRLMTWAAKFNPDVVSMNEVERYTGWGNFDGPANLAALMQQKTGRKWYYKFTTATGSSKGNGNLILSRFPFVSTTVNLLSHSRAAVDATIEFNGRTINFTSTHLDADSTSYRLQEIGELTSWARGLQENRIIAGDFNAWPGSSENAKMKDTYHDSWAVAQSKGTAIAYAGNTAGNTRNSRIDYIYYSEGAGSLTLKSSQVYDVRDSHGVMPSDHRPVMSVFSVK